MPSVIKAPFFLFTFILLITMPGLGQSVRTILFPELKDALFNKIAWVDKNLICMIGDKGFNGKNCPHVITIFDTSGAVACKPVNIKSEYSSQHEYVLIINKQIVFFNTKHDVNGRYYFEISATVDHKNLLNKETSPVFQVKEEAINLIEPGYSFHVYKGVYGLKAIATYNNNFIDKYSEGFQFRILDQNLNLSKVDTFNLPYNDRICNINDVVYDDKENKIYVLCNFFIVKEKERFFQNSFIGCFDISSGTYIENDNIPPFNQCKIQHCMVNGALSFSGISVIEKKYNEGKNTAFNIGIGPMSFSAIYSAEKTANTWKTVQVTVDEKTISTITSYSGGLDPRALKIFYNERTILSKDYISPVKMTQDATGKVHALWNYFISVDQMRSADKAVVPLILPIPGATFIGVMVMSSPSNESLITSSMLWLTYSDSLLTTSAMAAPLESNDYNLQAFGGGIINNRMYAFFNKSIGNSYSLNYPGIYSFKDSSLVQDTLLTQRMRQIPLNILYPYSIYDDNERLCFIGQYLPYKDAYGDNNVHEVKKYLVIFDK